jgi:hypothetical protein
MTRLARLSAPLFAALSLVGCGTTDPKIITREVLIEKPTPCVPKLPPRPGYADTDDALNASDDILARVKLLLVGREQRLGREEILEAALSECATPVASEQKAAG